LCIKLVSIKELYYDARPTKSQVKQVVFDYFYLYILWLCTTQWRCLTWKPGKRFTDHSTV